MKNRLLHWLRWVPVAALGLNGAWVRANLTVVGGAAAALREGEYADESTLLQYAVDEVPKPAKAISGIQRPQVTSPHGDSFDLWRLTIDDKKRVLMAQIRPTILRAQSQSEDLKGSLRLNAHPGEQNQSTARRALMMVAAHEQPNGWKMRAPYRKQGDGYLLEGVLFQGEQKRAWVKVDMKPDEAGLVGDLVAAVRKGVRE